MTEETALDPPRTLEPPDADRVLEQIFREHWSSLVALARLLIDRQAEAEEIVQEAFTRTYAAWPRLRRRDDPLPYLRRAVVNLSRGSLRRRATARQAPVDSPGATAGADHAVLLNDQQTEIARALRGLPDRQRECVVFRYLLECSTSETAEALDISEGTVKTHLHRALATLEAALEDPR